jgi:hypothetical protein
VLAPFGAAIGLGFARGLASFNQAFALMSSSLLIPLLTATGLAGFWLFYRAVDYCGRI